MQYNMLKGKIHRAVVKQADLNYVGSITVDTELLEAAGILSDNQNTDSHPLSSGAPGAEQAECFLRIIYFLYRSAAGCRSPHGWSQRSRSRTGCRGAAGGPGG